MSKSEIMVFVNTDMILTSSFMRALDAVALHTEEHMEPTLFDVCSRSPCPSFLLLLRTACLLILLSVVVLLALAVMSLSMMSFLG